VAGPHSPPRTELSKQQDSLTQRALKSVLRLAPGIDDLKLMTGAAHVNHQQLFGGSALTYTRISPLNMTTSPSVTPSVSTSGILGS
jgi:hypothetical protein